MALFWSKKPKAEKNYEAETRKATVAQRGASRGRAAATRGGTASSAAAKAVASKPARPSGRFDAATSAIVRPHITEKSGILSQQGVYTFVVSADANKPAIMKAVKHLYKVTPVKVAIVNLPASQVWVKGRWGRVPGTRKALVTVKKGDTIDFV